ncbi:hypothetical protein M9Y10_043232 [Tritrichomonas musculus]|uniref:Protein kinase domain-containing protein n=1 Tax=Tritrichomonas musculus TaxID=1915356 RepID=A0ABR2JZJ7_9EUKA
MKSADGKIPDKADQQNTKNITDNYSMIENIGGGTCGDVIKGMNIVTGEIVAMKKIKILDVNQGFPMNAMREIRILRSISHENIIKLHSVETSQDRYVYLIFDYCDYDLQGLLSQTPLSFQQTKCYFRQLLLALDVCAKKKLIHRDLKPANILLTPQNVVKLCDFGLAKEMNNDKNRPQTNQVITIWYRPPELLLGADHYGTEIDIWSSGCILYEMITRKILFRSNFDNELDEITAIFSVHGIPTIDEWSNWRSLPNAEIFMKNKSLSESGPKISFKEFLEKTIPKEYEDATDLLLKLLAYDPNKRISVTEALNHPFITKDFEQYLPTKIPEINLPSCHQNQLYEKTRSKKSKKDLSSLRPKKVTPRP